MRRITVAVCALALVAVGAPSVEAKSLKQQYLGLYDKAVEAGMSPGRNIAKHGFVTQGNEPGQRKATAAELRRSMATLKRWLAPPPEPIHVSGSYVGGPPGGGVPAELEAIAQCESGGSYTAQNPSGAYGKYQIMPGTAAAYGCDLSTASGQDACAIKIYAGGAGRSQWVC